MKAGTEMGMKPIQALNTLYIVKGKIEPYGKGMVAIITEKGGRVKYLDETKDKCTVCVTYQGEEYSETVTSSDPIIQNSKAAKISMRNKLRFHGVRMILNFQLPHLISSTSDLFEGYHEEASTDDNGNTLIVVSNEDVLHKIKSSSSLEELQGVFEEHKKTITKDINLLSSYGEAKKTFDNG